jgi:hypothetical protein
VTPKDAAHRRWIPCRLVTDEERPHERQDIEVANLREHVLENRAERLRDALIILKAHAVAGRPSEDKARLGSFETWDEVVRGAVWFATGLDCLVAQHEADEESPQRAADLALLEGWLEADPQGEGLCVPEAISMAMCAPDGITKATSHTTRYPKLYAALHLFPDREGQPNAKTIAYRIRAIKLQPIDNKRFVSKGQDHFHRQRWAVEDRGLAIRVEDLMLP